MKNSKPLISAYFTKSGLAVLAAILSVQMATAQASVAMDARSAVPLKVGVQVPNGALIAVDGTRTDLKHVLGGKPTLVIFYRGGWCPYCNTQLADLQSVEGQLRDLGVHIAAITPDTATEIRKAIDKHQLTYKIYSDSQANLLKKFGVAFRLDDSTYGMMKDRFHVDLESYSAQKHHILPVPSVFLVDAKGKIIFVHSNPDYKVRMKGSEIVEAAKTALN